MSSDEDAAPVAPAVVVLLHVFKKKFKNLKAILIR